jgi:predicted nucleic acid-binding protein
VSFVIDASLTLAWYFEDEAKPATDALLDRLALNGAVVPSLWRLEVGNAFQTAIRRKRVDAAFRDAALAELAAMPISVDPETDTHAWSTTLRLSERFALSLYDAAYLELAQRRSLPLASLDKELQAAAHSLNVTLLGAGA